MSMSYGELAYISNLTDAELQDMYDEIQDPYNPEKNDMSEQDIEDYENAILLEMESRGLPHP